MRTKKNKGRMKALVRVCWIAKPSTLPIAVSCFQGPDALPLYDVILPGQGFKRDAPSVLCGVIGVATDFMVRRSAQATAPSVLCDVISAVTEFMVRRSAQAAAPSVFETVIK
jgi:hypothetical protein